MLTATLDPLLIFLFICILPPHAAATNFTQCMNNFLNSNLTGGIDEFGNPVIASAAVGLTYQTCLDQCGSKAQSFDWPTFAQSFSGWLLPWLALVSNLPFGARRKLDNITALILPIGSPTLAVYSLSLTLLNGHWLSQRLNGIKYPNTRTAFHVLNSLQQAPLVFGSLAGQNPLQRDSSEHARSSFASNVPVKGEGSRRSSVEDIPLVTANQGDDDILLDSLVVLQRNDAWWKELHERLDYVHTWSIAAVASIFWVLAAYLLTVGTAIEALYLSTGVAELSASDGQAAGTAWLWILPLVVGWLWVAPKCDFGRIHAAITRANTMAYVAGETMHPILARTVSETFAIMLRPEGRANAYEDSGEDDELITCPIYNYSRVFVWSLHAERIALKFENAASKAGGHKPVHGRDWTDSSSLATDHENVVVPDNRVGTARQVMEYCEGRHMRRTPWAPGVRRRVFIASVMALMIQWSTSGSAIIILWFTPTIGLGCRSATYMLFASVSTMSWFLIVTSTFLIHRTNSPRGHSPTFRAIMRDAAIFLRLFGKLLAYLNALFIIVCCLMEFSQQYDTCYCNSQLLYDLQHRWNQAYDVIIITRGEISQLKTAWIGGSAIAFLSVTGYTLFIYATVNPT